jgi:MerR family transcriptional regulator, thiopeptide resistance regulator
MTTTHSTATRPTIVPILVYEDIRAAHDFLVEVFGFTSGGIHTDDEGAVVHGEVRLGDDAVWLHLITEEHQLDTPRDSAISHGGLSVLVPDVDAHFAHSRDGGALIDRPPTVQPYGLKEYGARDPENHRWWFATPTAG